MDRRTFLFGMLSAAATLAARHPQGRWRRHLPGFGGGYGDHFGV